MKTKVPWLWILPWKCSLSWSSLSVYHPWPLPRLSIVCCISFPLLLILSSFWLLIMVVYFHNKSFCPPMRAIHNLIGLVLFDWTLRNWNLNFKQDNAICPLADEAFCVGVWIPDFCVKYWSCLPTPFLRFFHSSWLLPSQQHATTSDLVPLRMNIPCNSFHLHSLAIVLLKSPVFWLNPCAHYHWHFWCGYET